MSWAALQVQLVIICLIYIFCLHILHPIIEHANRKNKDNYNRLWRSNIGAFYCALSHHIDIGTVCWLCTPLVATPTPLHPLSPHTSQPGTHPCHLMMTSLRDSPIPMAQCGHQELEHEHNVNENKCVVWSFFIIESLWGDSIISLCENCSHYFRQVRAKSGLQTL